jgi:hypothetical protein
MSENSETPFGHSFDAANQIQNWNDTFARGVPEPEDLPEHQEETVQRKVEIHGIYGSHTENDIKKLDNFKSELQKALENEKGNVLVCLESADLTDEASDKIYKLIEQGIKPSSAIREVLTSGKNLVERDKSSASEQTQTVESGTSSYLKEQVKIIDTFWEDQKYKGKIRLLWEGRPISQLEGEKDADPVLKFKIRDFSEPEKLHELITSFKKVINQQATSVISRDTSTLTRVSDRLTDKNANIGVVLLAFGTRHSYLSRGLNDLVSSNIELTNHTTFNDIQDGKARFQPYDQVLTTVLNTARKDGSSVSNAISSISSLNWEKALVGQILLSSSLNQANKQNLPLVESDLLVRIERAMKEFNTEAELESFLQKDGFKLLKDEIMQISPTPLKKAA